MFENTNPFPGLSSRYCKLTKSAVDICYQTGVDANGNPTWRPGFESLGSSEDIEVKFNPEYAKAKKTDTAISTEQARAVTGIEATGSLTLLQSSPLIRALSIMAADPTRKYTQALLNAVTKEFPETIEPGMTSLLGLKDISVASATWGVDADDEDVPLVLGQHYLVDRREAEIHWLAKPAAWVSGGPKAVVSAPAITAAAKIAKFGGASSPGLHARLRAKGVNTQGGKSTLMVWDALFVPNGGRKFQNTGTEFDKVTLDFSMFLADTDHLGNVLEEQDRYFTETDHSTLPLA